MLNSTKTAPALAQMQLTLNNYIWGVNTPGLSVSTDTTDEIFNRIKPILRKNPDPIYLSFTIDGLLKNSTLRDKVQKLISNISTDFSVSGMYNVAPIVEYVLFRRTDTDQGLSSQPELYFKKATAKSSGGLDFNYRDVMIQTLLPIVEEQSDYINPSESTPDPNTIKYLNNITLLIKLLGDDLIEASSPASEIITGTYQSRLAILSENSDQYIKLCQDLIFYISGRLSLNQDSPVSSLSSSIATISSGIDVITGIINNYNDTINLNIGKIIDEATYKKEFNAFADGLQIIPSIESSVVAITTSITGLSDPLPKNTTPSFNFDKVVFFIRLYPRAAQIAYPNVNITTGSVSDNRLLSVVNGATNLECVFSGNIALNTIDAQWLDLYANLFEFMTTTNISAGFSIKFGNITLNNCYFKNSPRMINTGEPISLFDLNIISTIRSLSGINVNNYGDNFSDALQ